KGPPLTLIISGLILLVLIIAVVFYYRAGPRSSNDAPPAVGTPVGEMKTAPAAEAQPLDPEAGINVYGDAEIPTEAPTFTPGPATVQPRPAPRASAPAIETPAPARPAPAVTPPAEKAETRPVASGGDSGVQIGAFSTPSLADREFNMVMARYPR